MATYAVSWAADGPTGEYQLVAKRARNTRDAQYLVAELVRDPLAVRVTIEHTGIMPNSQPRPIHTVWTKPGYHDPF